MLISKIFLGNGFEDVERLQVARRLIRGRAGGGGKKTAVRVYGGTGDIISSAILGVLSRDADTIMCHLNISIWEKRL